MEELNLDHIFLFGKYRGKSVQYVYEKNPSYINWCREHAPNMLRTKPAGPRKPKEAKPSFDENDVDEEREMMGKWVRGYPAANNTNFLKETSSSLWKEEALKEKKIEDKQRNNPWRDFAE
jgi:hypothetical protein